MAQKLFIGGLSFSTSRERLRELFGGAGEVESATVVTDRDTGHSRGFGFVEMATAEQAEAAVKKFNGQELDGRTLKVELAKPAGSGGSRPGGGYRSGGATGLAGRSEVEMQVVAFSTPSNPDWRWRIVNYAGEVVEESHETLPTIATAVTEGTKRLAQLSAVDYSKPMAVYRSTTPLRRR